MQPGTLFAVLLAAGAITPGLAACGDDSDGGSSSGGGALSKSELVKKADEICQAASKKVDALPAASDLGDPKVAADYFDKIVPITDGLAADLAALKPDADAKADWDAFITSHTENAALMQKIRDKAAAKDTSGIQDLAQIGTQAQKTAAAAEEFGAKACA